jgi:hypothetical protein
MRNINPFILKRLMMKTVKKILFITSLVSFLLSCSIKISDEAYKKFISEHGSPSILVYPVRVVMIDSAYFDAALSLELIENLKGFTNFRLKPTKDTLNMSIKWTTDHARLLNHSARSFSRNVSKKHISEEYALLVEVLCNNEETWVGAVNILICNNKGKMIRMQFNNSNHNHFSQINPKSPKDGALVARNMLLVLLRNRG